MNKYLLEKNNLKVSKITIKNNDYLLETPLGLYVLKKENIKTYDYLLSRGFNYFPKIIDYDNEYILFEYIEGIDYDSNLKAQDLIRIISLMHSKTSYFKNITNENNEIYNNIKSNINYLNNYYNNLISVIEDKEYYSPEEYLLIRNSSIIFSSINYSYNLLEEWYKKYKNNNKKRVVTLYNNFDINNVIRTKDNIYITNLNKVYVDRPIYDLVNFYNKYYLEYDFYSLIKSYEKVFSLSLEEIDLFLLLTSIPGKIDIKEDIYSIKKKINKVYKGLELLKLKETKDTSAHKKEDNK